MNLLFKDSMKAWVIVTTMIAAGGIAAPILAGVATWHLGRHGDHSIGSMDTKFTLVQVPQFKSDLHGGAIDIVAVTSHVTVSQVAWVVLSTQSARAEQSRCQHRPGQSSALTEVPEQAPAKN
ncbi:hypothetical protein EDD17DRAFT_1504923 [Pisolithus thermaeus]|nr:hypothetical protein EV401DRAFT_1896205 [Pisolithus croceorrhizus]KAI6166502.1 hypothetical protein EDD17DRAFT_1504923 [Pisolithus thermaeus]